MATLSIQIPNGENIDFPIQKKSTIIGRDESCDLVINNSYISSQHAVIHRSDEGTFVIEDKESTHGVRVNDVRVVAEKLTDGDKITLGQLDILLHVTAAAAAAPSPSPSPATPTPMRSPGKQQVSTPEHAPPPRPVGLKPPVLKRHSPATTQPMPVEEPAAKPTRMAAPMRPGPKPNHITSATISAPSRMPSQKNESGPRTTKVAASPELKTAKTDLQAEVAELKEKLKVLKSEESEKRNLYQDSLEDMRSHIGELGQEKRKLRDEVEDLRERARSVGSRIDDESDAFLPVMFEVVKRVDLLEGMIQSLESSRSPSEEVTTQLRTLRASFDDLFERHNIRTESVEPGTQLNMGLRRKIRIVDAAGNAAEENPRPDTSVNHMPAQSKVVETIRPGIIYAPAGGEEVLLRKVEVTVEEA